MRPEKPSLVTEGRGFDSRHLHSGVSAKCQTHSWRRAGATANSGGPGFVLSGWSSHAQAALPGPQSSTSPSQVVYAGLSRVTQVWLAGEPRDAVGVRHTAAEPLRCQMRPVSWAHMASSTRFR